MVATKTGVSWRLQTSLLQAALVASISMSALRLIAQWPSDIHFDGSSNVWAINKQQSCCSRFCTPAKWDIRSLGSYLRGLDPKTNYRVSSIAGALTKDSPTVASGSYLDVARR